MQKWLILIILFLIILFILLYNIVNHTEDKVLFYPSTKRIWKPKIPYETIYLNTNNEEVCYSSSEKIKDNDYISCWHFNNYKNKPHILFFHGNSGNVTNRSYIINLCDKFKLNLFLFDYSGFGTSTNKPHKLFLRENAETVYNYLHRKINIPRKDIVIWSESLGCVSASYLASKYECGGLIMLCGFSSLDDVLKYTYKGYKRTAVEFLASMLSYKMDLLPVKDYLSYTKCPVVIIHSKKDNLIPYECSRINYNRIFSQKKLHITIDGNHSGPKITSKQLTQTFDFLDIPHDLSSDKIDDMLKSLETFAKRNNNFMNYTL